MNIDWNKIKNEYPESYNKYKDWIQGGMHYLTEKEITQGTCYCDLEKFFDDNEIKICITYCEYCHTTTDQLKEWGYKIHETRSYYYEEIYCTRKEAKEAAIYKAFEIMEDKLNGK